MSAPDFAVGDTVRIIEHKTAPCLYPDRVYTVEASGGWVIDQINLGRAWPYGGWRANLSKFVEGDYDYKWQNVSSQQMELVKKGDGTFIPGVTLPPTPKLIWDARVAELQKRWEDSPTPTHEGFCNAATWQTVLWLNQDPRTERRIPGMRRKDGTVNPSKMEKLFRELKLQLEDWVRLPHIEIPEDMKRVYLHNWQKRLGVNWEEVAGEFAAEPAPTPALDTESIETQEVRHEH